MSDPERLTRRLARLDRAIDRLEEASPLLLPGAQQQVQQALDAVYALEDGPAHVLARVRRVEAAGLFRGTPWEDPARLQARLLAGGLLGDPPYPVMEATNLLRLLARAVPGEAAGDGAEGGTTAGDGTEGGGTGGDRDGRPHEDGSGMSPEAAATWLEQAVALNVDLLFPRDTEASRGHDPERFRRAGRVFALIVDRLPHTDLVRLVVDEVEGICHQRPVWTDPVRLMVRLASGLPGASDDPDDRVHLYVEAILGPSPMSRRFREAPDYRDALREVDEDALRVEADDMAASLRRTGLACRQHAVLLRHLAKHQPELVPQALGLDVRGRQECERHQDLVHDLIRAAVHPSTCQTAYGLARLLERGVVDQPAVADALRQIVGLDLHPDVERHLVAQREESGVPAAAWLLSGAIRVLGQPLGVGQGRNPTCQAARGISLWSQHRPDYLLQLIHDAGQYDDVVLSFGGEQIHSKDLPPGLAWRVDPELDPVSLVLVPHLDRLYDQMMRRVAHQGDDGHRWVNPGLYGRTVPTGFSTCFDHATWQVRDHRPFLRRFWATHHPEYQDDAWPYPNPVGIIVTTANADLLGLHAVTVQRVGRDPDGELRIYFYNPNNEGRQDWGQEIHPTVHGNGEMEGESSLPFHQFASRLYAFHFDPFSPGDADTVPASAVAEAHLLARESWGRSYTWAGHAPEPSAGGPLVS